MKNDSKSDLIDSPTFKRLIAERLLFEVISDSETHFFLPGQVLYIRSKGDPVYIFLCSPSYLANGERGAHILKLCKGSIADLVKMMGPELQQVRREYAIMAPIISRLHLDCNYYITQFRMLSKASRQARRKPEDPKIVFTTESMKSLKAEFEAQKQRGETLCPASWKVDKPIPISDKYWSFKRFFSALSYWKSWDTSQGPVEDESLEISWL